MKKFNELSKEKVNVVEKNPYIENKKSKFTEFIK